MKKKVTLFGIECQVSLTRRQKKKVVKKKVTKKYLNTADNVKLNFGPGPNWIKPSEDWLNVDIDPSRGDVIVNFKDFVNLPLKDNSVLCVYGSHVFEHMSIFKTPIIFAEIFRVLKEGGVFRLILPDAEKSIKEYVNGNKDFLLFKRRKDRALINYKKDYTLFECLREDFLSPNGQIDLLGKESLAHQNAWDYETIKLDLVRAGFDTNNIKKMSYKNSQTNSFSFEGAYDSEANQDYRSLYVEAVK